MNVRCKFKCHSTMRTSEMRRGEDGVHRPHHLYTATMVPVYSDDPEDPNKKWWEATPNGRLEVGTWKEMPFEPGKEYFIDITPAQ